MKKIINNKVYDTENAECICNYSFGNPNNFRYICEDIYKSSNGQFFIQYSGGAMSKYSIKHSPNNVSGSNGIRLVTDDEAKDFIEDHGTCEDYVKAFGEPEIG